MQMSEQVVIAQANQGVASTSHVPTLSIRVRDIIRMNLAEFHDYKANEYLQQLIDEAYRIMDIIEVPPDEKLSYCPIN